MQYELLLHVRHLITLSTRWFLHNNRLKEGTVPQIIEHYSKNIEALREAILSLMSGVTKTYLENLTEQFLKSGLKSDMARYIASYRVMYTGLNVIEVATRHDFNITKTAKLYFKVGERFNLVWFRDQVANDARDGMWNALARLTLRDELDHLQRQLTIVMMNHSGKEMSIDNLIASWLKKNKDAFERWEKLITSVHSSATVDYTIFFIVLRELDNLVQESD